MMITCFATSKTNLTYAKKSHCSSSEHKPDLATAALFTANAPSELYPPGIVSTESRFTHFMVNERTRELCGEFYRWEDLVRTETFYDRTKLFNADVSPSFAPFHKLRPIPYLLMIAQSVNGKPMTGADMAAYQNTGY